MMGAAVCIEDVCFSYDTREILHNISLSVEEGSFSVMVGPNGGGKTTLLRLILGLLSPRYGTISVLGRSPVQARQLVGYVPQSLQYDSQFPVTVEDVVLMGRVERHLFGNYDRHDREIAAASLAEVNLEGFENRSFQELSGGERHRTLVAQALASEPRMLLLDEPGANLDPENRRMLYELLGRLNQRLTILLVSHNLNVVASFATHIICVNRTADMHPIAEVSKTALSNGIWTHLMHEGCPVADPELEDSHTPHHGECHSCVHHQHGHCLREGNR